MRFQSNVAVSLSNYGLDAGFISALPDNDIGQSAINSLRALGVDTSNVKRQGDRVGIYYLETGANHMTAPRLLSAKQESVTLIGRQSLKGLSGSTLRASHQLCHKAPLTCHLNA